jgi:hypothetical protein
MKLFIDKTFLAVFMLGCLGTSKSYASPFTAVIQSQPCADNFEVFDNTQIQTMESDGVCYFSIHPRNSEHLLYRDFLFDSDGLAMVFDSYGEGSESQTTAAREFLFFPRNQMMKYEYDAQAKRLMIHTPSGKVFGFNSMKSILTDISGTQSSINYEITPANRGGLEIVANDGLYMDGGFARGHSPSQNSKDKVIFKDREGHSCTLANGDIYSYDSDGDTKIKYNDVQLKTYLSGQCSQLKL